MQVVGPSVRVFGLCLDATSTGICKQLSPAMDMLLMPHMPESFASFGSLVQLYAQIGKLDKIAIVRCMQGSPRLHRPLL